MKMALFFSKTPQTFEVVKQQPACLSDAGDAVRFTGIIPQNKVNRIKNLIPTYITLVCTPKVRFLLNSSKERKKQKTHHIKILEKKSTLDFKTFQWSLSSKCLPVMEVNFYDEKI